MRIEDLEAKKGEPVLPKWKLLLEWIRGLRVITGPGIRLNNTPHGVVATVHSRTPPWAHPWKVSAGDIASIRAGTVRGVVARIKDRKTKTYRRLDGRDEDGGISDEGLPELDLDLDLADDEGRTFLVVGLSLLDDGTIDEESEVPVEVYQSADIPKDTHVIAVIYLTEDGSAIEESFQIAHHNLDFARTVSDSGASRVLFFPV